MFFASPFPASRLSASLAAQPRRRVIHAILGAAIILFLAFAAPVAASEDSHPALHDAAESQTRSFSTGTAFFDDSSISGSVYYFQRKRMRKNIANERWRNNLDHATTGIGAEFSSGFLGGVIGADVGAFSATDLWNSNLPFHELSFFPARDPWSVNWEAQHPRNGVSVHKALLKFKHKDFWGKTGYFQPTGPGVLGVNWSMFPGTYRGAEAGITHGGFSAAAAWADQYKAPWFRDTYHFRRDDGSHVAWLWSLGARYAFDETSPLAGTTMEAAYGESEKYLQNAHIKIAHERPLGGGAMRFGWHLYVQNDSASSGANDNFAKTATQHFLFSRYVYGPWTFRVEFTYTEAPQNTHDNKGYFAYRLISQYGGAKGALEPDWNTRSDWNHDQEKALFFTLSRTFSILGHTGFEAGATYSHGWDGKAYGYSGRLNEWAFAFDLGYTVPKGPLKGAAIKAHYTEYRNSSDMPDWEGFKNAFQDERDFKLIVSVPFSL